MWSMWSDLKELGFSLKMAGEVPKFQCWRGHHKERVIRWEVRKSVYCNLQVKCKAAAPVAVGSQKVLGARLECTLLQVLDQTVGLLSSGLVLCVVEVPGSCVEVPCSFCAQDFVLLRSLRSCLQSAVGSIRFYEQALPEAFCIIKNL